MATDPDVDSDITAPLALWTASHLRAAPMIQSICLFSVVMLTVLSCSMPATVDSQADAYGDPGAAAWDCEPEVLTWDAAQETGGSKWGGACSSSHRCSGGTFVATCSATAEGYWSCTCDNHGSAGPTFNASGYCDMNQDQRAVRSNTGCGWKIPVSNH